MDILSDSNLVEVNQFYLSCFGIYQYIIKMWVYVVDFFFRTMHEDFYKL